MFIVYTVDDAPINIFPLRWGGGNTSGIRLQNIPALRNLTYLKNRWSFRYHRWKFFQKISENLKPTHKIVNTKVELLSKELDIKFSKLSYSWEKYW